MGGRGASSISRKNGGAPLLGEAPALDRNLIRRANAAGTVVDYGDLTSAAYARNVEEIKTFDMTPSERKEAFSKLHELTENQLRAEARAVNPYTSGTARFDRAQVNKNAENAIDARRRTDSYMESLRSANRAKKSASSAKSLNDAFVSAYNRGELEVTYNGVTYRRRNRRSNTFTRVK